MGSVLAPGAVTFQRIVRPWALPLSQHLALEERAGAVRLPWSLPSYSASSQMQTDGQCQADMGRNSPDHKLKRISLHLKFLISGIRLQFTVAD